MRPRIALKTREGKIAKEDIQQLRTTHSHSRHTKPEKRLWLHIDVHGISQDLEVGKHVIMKRAHLPARDLRLLDPLLSYPSSILGREHAIVVNLEHIKSIITAQEVFLLDAHNPIVAPFVQDLRCRLPSNYNHNQGPSPEGCDHDNPGCQHHSEDRERGQNSSTNSPQDPSIDHTRARERLGRVDLSMSGSNVEIPSEVLARDRSELLSFYKPSNWSCPMSRGPRLLPFEFRALEACLEAACHRLDSEAGILAQDAHNALDALTSHVSTKHLENVRQVKNQLVLISGRAQRVRDEIENLLDDDGDMAEMYLTDKLLRQQREGSFRSNDSDTRSMNSTHGDGVDKTNTEGSYPEVTLEDTVQFRQNANLEDQWIQPHSDQSLLGLPAAIPRSKRHLPKSPPREDHHKHKQHGIQLEPPHHSILHARTRPEKQIREHLKLVSFHVDHDDPDSQSRASSYMSRMTGAGSIGKHQDVEELEMLLEAYFVLVDGIIHHVASVKEYVDDTEDYVKIMLDDHQNTLLKVNVVLTISCLVIGVFVAVTGIFGMNIQIPLYTNGTSRDFWSVVGISSAASVILSGLVIGWCKYTQLI